MKKIISLFLAIFMIFGTLCLASCENHEQESESSSSSDADQTSSTATTDTGEEESSTQDPADVFDPNAPDNQTITLFTGEETDYVIVCDKENEEALSVATELKGYFKSEYNVTIKINDKDDIEQELEIVIGNVRENVQFVANRLYPVNDFAISVCDNDLVLYATSEHLYDYMLEMAKKTISEVLAPEKSFIYHKSSYADIEFAQYIKTTCPSGVYNHEGLLKVFEPKAFEASNGTSLNYRLYVPASYDENKSYPVVLFLHGAGERGSDNSSQLVNMMPYLFSIKDNPYHESIVIAPQCPSGQQWVDTPWGNGNYSTEAIKESNELTAVAELIEGIDEQFSTDKNRYYVIGLSMGGFGAWDMIMRHTELFTAAMPLCGGADPQMAEGLVNFPIKTFHGVSDSTVPSAGTKAMVEAIKQACADAGVEEKIIYEPLAADHIIWNTVAKNATHSKWLFKQVKPDTQ